MVYILQIFLKEFCSKEHVDISNLSFKLFTQRIMTLSTERWRNTFSQPLQLINRTQTYRLISSLLCIFIKTLDQSFSFLCTTLQMYNINNNSSRILRFANIFPSMSSMCYFILRVISSAQGNISLKSHFDQVSSTQIDMYVRIYMYTHIHIYISIYTHRQFYLGQAM